MSTPSAAAWPIRASIAKRAPEPIAAPIATLILALVVLAALAWRAAAAEPARIEQHDGFDRLVLPFGVLPDGRPPQRPAIPLLRRGEGSYRIVLPVPLPPIAGIPRGVTEFLPQRRPDGQIGVIDLVPAAGAYLRYRATADGFALDVVHGLAAPMRPVATPIRPPPAGPLPPKVAHAGVLFSAPRLAALRLGDELILFMPVQGDLDPATIPPARVAAAAAVEQGRHRLVRLTLRPDTHVEIRREGARQWRLGFSADGAVAPARTRFATDGRSLLVATGDDGAEFATLKLPELGAVAIVLTAVDWAMAPARSPFLDVLDALIGGVVVPRTDGLAIERRPNGIAISGVDRRSGG